jgi:hypothetical protein
MSAHLNNVSGTIYEDLIVKMMGKRYSELTASIIMKFTVIVMGVMCGILVLMVEQLKGILQASFLVIRLRFSNKIIYKHVFILDGG